MHMTKLTFDPERHHYAFGKYDRVNIDGFPHKTVPHGRNEEGWLLELDDGSGRCTSYDHKTISRLGARGQIHVERDYYAPEPARRRLVHGGQCISELAAAPAARLTKKNAYTKAFLELQGEKLIKMTDESIAANRDLLRSRAMAYADRLIGGSNAAQSQDLNVTPSARTLRRWVQNHRVDGMVGLIDAMNRRGSRDRRMGGEELALLMSKVEGYASEKRPSIKKIHEDVVEAFDTCNENRAAGGLHRFPVPSYETVRRAIKTLEPFKVALARDGADAARMKFAPVGTGPRLTRPLQRVEIDENTIDIVSFMESSGLLPLMMDDDRIILGLDKSKARWFLTVAICTTTRCILGMAFSRSAKEGASLQVLQMLLGDKGKCADAAGSLGSWDMHGTPALIVTDTGPAFKSQRFQTACADLGITTLRAPAGLPEVRGRNERFFLSLNTGLHPRLPGRTFNSIREKGNADPGKTAALTFDDLAFCLVRWIVDIYHNTPHAGLGGETPLSCWRRLTSEWGVQPPPDQAVRRMVFGQNLHRKLTREGVTVLGVRYHSETLARWITTRRERDVEVRWHPDDISAVTVYVAGQKFQVGAVQEGFEAVTAREWLAACRALRAGDPHARAYDRKIVMKAIQAIRDRSSSATKLAGLIAEDWSPERIRQEEDRLFLGFSVADEHAPPAIAADGLGRSIPDPAIRLAGTGEPEAHMTGDDPRLAATDHARAPGPNPPGPAHGPGSWKITE